MVFLIALFFRPSISIITSVTPTDQFHWREPLWCSQEGWRREGGGERGRPPHTIGAGVDTITCKVQWS